MRSRQLAVSAIAILPILIANAPLADRSDQPPSEPAVQDQTDPELERFLAEFDAKRKSFEDYRATFRQQKYNRLFDEFSEPATGVLSYKRPGRALWEYRTPDKMTVLLRDQRVHMYIADLEQMEIYDFRDRRSARALFLGFDQTPDELRESYRITLFDPKENLPKTYGVQLEPRSEEMARYFTRVKLWLRATDFAAVRVLIEGPEEGNVTAIEFTDIHVNTGIPDSTFDLNLPPGTTIVEHSADELQPTFPRDNVSGQQ